MIKTVHLPVPCVETLDSYEELFPYIVQSLFHRFCFCFFFKIKAKTGELEMGKHFPET